MPIIQEWHQLACGNPWGKWLLVIAVCDKILELILGELAKRQKISHGSVLALLVGAVMMLFWFLIKEVKGKEK
jgi:hypothetical protein